MVNLTSQDPPSATTTSRHIQDRAPDALTATLHARRATDLSLESNEIPLCGANQPRVVRGWWKSCSRDRVPVSV